MSAGPGLRRPRIAADAAALREEVLLGLRQRPKRLSSRLLYDARGSQLFERICEQPEYYLTRTELAIMRDHAPAMAAALGPGTMLIEYGSGSARKTGLLLRALRFPRAYVPVEISASALLESLRELAPSFPDLELLPLYADFTRELSLPTPRRPESRRVIYFPGSTLGNFTTAEALQLLRRMRRLAGDGGAALIGVDLLKSPAELVAAYNDAAGVTAAFTLNLLLRLNRELGASFDLDAFEHRAVFNAAERRIETSIVSRRDQLVRIAGAAVGFARGEELQVEISCKYSLADLSDLAADSGFRLSDAWQDPDGRFAVVLLTAA